MLRIEAEEPVFYIGPETRPPRRQGATLAQQFRAGLRDMRHRMRTPAAARPAAKEHWKAMREAGRERGGPPR